MTAETLDESLGLLEDLREAIDEHNYGTARELTWELGRSLCEEWPEEDGE